MTTVVRTREKKAKKSSLLIIGVVVLVCLLALALGLGLGLGLEHNPTIDLKQEKPPLSWQRDPQDYVLSNKFDTSATPTTRTFTFNLTEIPNGAPDGVSRRMLLINGKFPGPVVETNEGDRLEVQVNNFMTIPAAIHWHGQYQNGISRYVNSDERYKFYGRFYFNYSMSHSSEFDIYLQLHSSTIRNILVSCALLNNLSGRTRWSIDYTRKK